MEMRYKLQAALDKSPETIRSANTAFAEAFGRNHGGMLWEYHANDADLILVGMGSLASEATAAADILRAEGIKAGVVGIRVYRPFPKEDVRDVFRNAKAVVIFEKSISYGYEGGLCSDLKAAFYGTNIKAPIHGYIAGLGGRDVKARELVAAAKDSLASFDRGMVEPKTTWLSTFTG
jgi:pyruvate/2-oxoacid:ferredoxin oxidoreductase alpha subunit